MYRVDPHALLSLSVIPLRKQSDKAGGIHDFAASGALATGGIPEQLLCFSSFSEKNSSGKTPVLDPANHPLFPSQVLELTVVTWSSLASQRVGMR